MPKSSGRSSSESSGGEFSSTCRQQRNIAEKQRRDKLNSYISELASIVPLVSQSGKRLDKTSILRLTAAHIRMHKSVIKGQRKLSRIQSWRPTFINLDHLTELLEDVEGFLFISSNTGKIIYMSSSVERFLGHQNIDTMGHSFLNFVHPADVDMVEGHFRAISDAIDKEEPVARCSFHCRIREKSQPRSEVVSYQLFKVNAQMMHQHKSDECEQEDSCSSKTLLKGFAQLVHSSPFSQISFRNSISDEYVTFHDVLGRIIKVDQNISTITGHLPEEVMGKSAYDYIIPEDIFITSFAQKLMFSNSHGRGLVVYRLRTITNSSVFLMSSGYLHFDSETGQISHFVCINRLLNAEIGEKELKKFQLRFSPHSLKEICSDDASPPAQRATESPLTASDDSQNTVMYIETLSPHQRPSSAEIPSPNSSTSATTDSCVFVERSTLIADDASDFDLNLADSRSTAPQASSECSELLTFDADTESSLFFSDIFQQSICSDQTESPLSFIQSPSSPFSFL